MKTIINEFGEVIDVDDTNELMVKELYDLGTNLAQYDELEEQAEYIQEQLEQWKIANRENIIAVMKKNNEKSIKTDKRTYSLIPETVKKSLDIDRLKKEGIYDNYLKLSRVKESLRITSRRK